MSDATGRTTRERPISLHYRSAPGRRPSRRDHAQAALRLHVPRGTFVNVGDPVTVTLSWGAWLAACNGLAMGYARRKATA